MKQTKAAVFSLKTLVTIMCLLGLSFYAQAKEQSEEVLEKFRTDLRSQSFPEGLSHEKFCFNTWSMNDPKSNPYYIGLPTPGNKFGRVQRDNGIIVLESEGGSYVLITLINNTDIKDPIKRLKRCEAAYDRLIGGANIKPQNTVTDTLKIGSDEYKRIKSTIYRDDVNASLETLFQCLSNNKEITFTLMSQRISGDTTIENFETLKIMLENFHYTKASE